MHIKALIASLDKVLKPKGFKRRSATWNRTSSTFVDVVAIQKDKSGESFTINAGVFDPEVSRIFWDEYPSDWINEVSCIVRTRIGDLMGDYDVWWPINDLSAEHEAGEGVSSLILPFLDGLHSRSAMIDELRREGVLKKHYLPPKFYLVILLYLEGKKSSALTLLQEIRETVTENWYSRIDDVFNRLL